MSRHAFLAALLVVVVGLVSTHPLSRVPLSAAALHYLYVVGVAGIVGWLLVALERERRLARTDGLTGLANRRTFTEAADARIRALRRGGRPFTVLYIDIDGFKAVNDRMGHAAGDLLLRSVAATLSHELRRGDVVARLGGDEFAVLLDGDRDEPVVGRLFGALQSDPRARSWGAGFSIGAVTFRTPPIDVDDMLHRADAAMYLAKQRGDHVVFRVA